MALRIKANNPQSILEKIKSDIEHRHIQTWRLVKQGNNEFFTHVTSDKQWDSKAFLKPSISEDQLVFHIVRPDKGKVDSETYAVYHGRFAEMLLAHFAKEFSIVWASALPESTDLV